MLISGPRGGLKMLSFKECFYILKTAMHIRAHTCAVENHSNNTKELFIIFNQRALLFFPQCSKHIEKKAKTFVVVPCCHFDVFVWGVLIKKPHR